MDEYDPSRQSACPAAGTDPLVFAPPAPADPMAQFRTLVEFSRVAGELAAAQRRFLMTWGFSRSESLMLLRLYAHQPAVADLTELAEYAAIAVSTASTTLSHLRHRGFVQSVGGSVDLRLRAFRLTSYGERLAARLFTIHVDAACRMLGGLSANQRGALRQACAAIRTSLHLFGDTDAELTPKTPRTPRWLARSQEPSP
ncbi:MAG: MarR family winged helix-turn-helix transcriptional regulator [Longimicrobiales bacterium]